MSGKIRHLVSGSKNISLRSSETEVRKIRHLVSERLHSFLGRTDNPFIYFPAGSKNGTIELFRFRKIWTLAGIVQARGRQAGIKELTNSCLCHLYTGCMIIASNEWYSYSTLLSFFLHLPITWHIYRLGRYEQQHCIGLWFSRNSSSEISSISISISFRAILLSSPLPPSPALC